MSTNRQQLLERAGQYSDASVLSLELAECITSERDVTVMKAELQHRRAKAALKVSRGRTLAVSVLVLLMLATVALSAVWTHSVWPAVFAITLLITSIGVILRICIAEDQAMRHRTQLSKLEPISGTDRCLEALQYLESSYPDVQAWRDQALSTRDQLYVFDVDVLKYLYQQEEAKQAKTDAQKRNEEACRKVHGLVSAHA